MESFIRPILWALLVGAGLFPLKTACKEALQHFLAPKQSDVPILSVSVFGIPGKVGRGVLFWLWSNKERLVLLGLSIGLGLSVEQMWDTVFYMVTNMLVATSYVKTAFQLWGNFSVASVIPAVFWSLMLGVPGVYLLRNHKFALLFLSSLLWLVLIVFVLPAVYAFFPVSTFIPLSVCTFFCLIGLLQRKKRDRDRERKRVASPAVTVKKKAGRGTSNMEKGPSKSSVMVTFLAFGCFCILFFKYLPYLGVCVLFLSQINRVWTYLVSKMSVSEEVLSILFLPPIRWMFGKFRRGDRIFRAYLLRHLDSIATVCAVLLFVAGAVIFSVYFSFCIYQEAQELGRHATTIWTTKNKSAVHEVVAGGVLKGVEWVETNMLNGTSKELALSQKLFNFSSFNNEEGFSLKQLPNITEMWDTFSKLDQVFDSAREKGQQVLTYAFYTMYSAVLQMTGILVSSFIFLTLLFYLLAASDKKYRPFVWIESLQKLGGNLDEYLIHAIEDVFHTTIMVSTFHGLFTWLSFSLLQARWVAISTVSSMILAGIPIVGPYWVAVPAGIELYYSKSNMGPAVALVGSQFLIYFFVDPMIYAETGAHPYMTALSVVGGLYLIGIEGIVVGPLLLVVATVILQYINNRAGSSKQRTTTHRADTQTPLRPKKLKDF
jgi:predicted PurR-regulated permease PerM